jgi:hypothetical protein
MARYTLKTYSGLKQLERFDHRSSEKLRGILEHPRHHRAGQPAEFGDTEEYADRFEILDSLMTKLFTGNITEALTFARKLR